MVVLVCIPPPEREMDIETENSPPCPPRPPCRSYRYRIGRCVRLGTKDFFPFLDKQLLTKRKRCPWATGTRRRGVNK